MAASPQRLTIRFRPMVLADIPRVHQIDLLSFSMPWSERSYRFEVTENSHSLLLVAEAIPPGGLAIRPDSPDGTPDGQVDLVGMIVIWVIMDEAHVATIATHPDFRGQGIGRRLLARGLLAAYERGARLAYLEVRRSNQVAQKLYEQFGFKVVGERPRYYQDNNEDALLMTLESIQLESLKRFVD